MAKKPTLLYRREIDEKVLELTEHNGVYELSLSNGPGLDPSHFSISIALVDPTYSNPTQQARRV
jgi:hypothetical protein